MGFWSKWFRKAPIIEETPPTKQNLAFTGGDRAYVRSLVDQLADCGLRIRPNLDRELIVARALIDADLWGFEGCETVIESSCLGPLFSSLACETDSVTYYVKDIEDLFTPLIQMNVEESEEMLRAHSYSVFENANTVSMLNEDNSLERLIHEFSDLTDEALKIDDVAKSAGKRGFTKLSFHAEGVGNRHCEVEDVKQTNIIPVLVVMNGVTESVGLGSFAVVLNGSGEEAIIVYAAGAMLSKILDTLQLKHLPDDGDAVYAL